MEDLISEQDLRTLRSASELASVETNKYGVPLTQFASGPAKEDALRITEEQVTPELIQYAQAPNTADARVFDTDTSSIDKEKVEKLIDFSLFPKAVAAEQESLGALQKDIDPTDPKSIQAYGQTLGFLQALEEKSKRKN